jgi:ATP-dependent Clp protease adaptor protein ClpS
MPPAEAFSVMMHVHQAGIGVAGLFTRDVAETKVKATQKLAEQHQFPLLVTLEPDPEAARP